MSELQNYSELSAEAKAALTEAEYENIKAVFELDAEGNPILKKPLDLSM